MKKNRPDSPGGDEETTVYTIRGIRKSLDDTITDIAEYYGKPKATLLREFIEQHFSDHIRNFEMNSPLVSTLDAEMAAYLGAEMLEDRFSNFNITRHNHEFLRLLGITSEDGLRTLLLNNAPFLRLRADQVGQGLQKVPRGISLTFALFAELASRSDDTILEANKTIFHYLTQGSNDRYFRHINQIRAEKNRPPVLPNSVASASGERVTVTVYCPPGYQAGTWKIHIRLSSGTIQPPPGIPLPHLAHRLLLPGVAYRQIVVTGDDEAYMGARFKNGVCELDLYTTGAPEDEDPVSLKMVARELIESIERNL